MGKFTFKITFLLALIAASAQAQIIGIISSNSVTPDPTQKLVFTTNSTSTTWSPSKVHNTGNTLQWDIDGTNRVIVNDPTFNLSTNPGTVNVNAWSTDNFALLDSLTVDNLGITAIDVTKATKLIDFSCKQNATLQSIDLTTMPFVQRLTIRSNDLQSVNLVNNTALHSLYIYGNVDLATLNIANNPLITSLDASGCNLPSQQLDQIVINLNTFGLTGGDLTIANNAGSLTSASYTAYLGLQSKGWKIDVAAPDAPPAEAYGTPVLSNFHIDNAQPSRVVFDANADITGLTTTGFVISGKTISSVTIDGDGLGGYFTVSSTFTFWDNNTIRLGENNNLTDQNTKLHNFTMEYITNNIIEPTAATNRYVSVAGGGDGTSEASPWTWAQAVTNAAPGMTIWVKAGNYGHYASNIDKSTATPTNPIKFIGYKTSTGGVPDVITDNYFDYGVTMLTSEMPTFTNTTFTSSGVFLYLRSGNLMFKNFQFNNYYRAFTSSSSGSNTCRNIYLDRINTKDFTWTDAVGNTALHFYAGASVNHIRIKNSVIINNASEGLTIQNSGSEFNLIDNVKTYSDNVSGTLIMDYHITINGNNSIIRNCHSENFNDTSTNVSTHGITIKSAGVPSEYNLIVDNVSVNSLECYALRNIYVEHNVIKRNLATKTHVGGYTGEVSGGIWFWGGVNYNIVENNKISNTIFGIGLKDNEGEDGVTDASVGSYNVVRNNIVYNTKAPVCSASSLPNADFSNNWFYNNTFHTASLQFYYPLDADVVITNLYLTNNSFTDIPASGSLTGMTFDYNNFYNSWTTGIGANDTNVNPSFVDTVDFVPQTTMSVPRVAGIYYDYNGDERGTTTTIGAQRIEVIEEPPVDPPTYTPDYYVSSSTGNDSNDGLTELTAWATMSKINSSNVADKVVAFKGGDSFTGTITKNYLGTQNTIYTSYGTGKAKIIGYEQITGWAEESTNLWYASTIGKTVYHVMIGEDLQTNARIPKISSDFAMQGNYYEITSVSSSSIFIATSLIGSADLVGAYCYVKSYMDTLIKRTITAFNPTTGQVTLDSAVTAMSSDDIFFVNNHKNITTVAGDWYYDAGNNRLYIYSTTSPTNINAITKADRPFFFEGSSAITFDNIEFNGLYLGAMYFESGSSYVVQNCSFKNIYESSIHSNFGVTTATISDNVFENLNSAAVNMYSTNINTTITGNTINNIGLLSNLSYLGYSSSTSQGTGLALYKGSASGNTITNCGYNGIAAYGGGTVENNFIEDVCLSGTDGAGIYTYEHATYGSIGTIQNNIIINNNSLDGTYLWQSMGIYCDQSSQDVQVLNNTVTNFYHNIFMNHGARNSFTGNNLYKSYREPVLMKLLDGYPLVNESNTLTYNEVYSDSNTYDCIKHYNEKDATLGWVSYDYNKYFNPQLSTSVYVIASGLTAHDTLTQWQTRTSQDANSIDDSAQTITGSHLAYNSTGASASISLPTGTWKGLDGTGSYTGTITLAAYTGKILIK